MKLDLMEIVNKIRHSFFRMSLDPHYVRVDFNKHFPQILDIEIKVGDKHIYVSERYLEIIQWDIIKWQDLLDTCDKMLILAPESNVGL